MSEARITGVYVLWNGLLVFRGHDCAIVVCRTALLSFSHKYALLSCSVTKQGTALPACAFLVSRPTPQELQLLAASIRPPALGPCYLSYVCLQQQWFAGAVDVVSLARAAAFAAAGPEVRKDLTDYTATSTAAAMQVCLCVSDWHNRFIDHGPVSYCDCWCVFGACGGASIIIDCWCFFGACGEGWMSTLCKDLTDYTASSTAAAMQVGRGVGDGRWGRGVGKEGGGGCGRCGKEGG
jgi:hypothetical protein